MRGDTPDAAAVFDAWYVRTYPQAWRFALRFLHSKDAATDVAQDFFLHVWQNRASLRVDGALLPYVLGAIRNRALTLLKHERMVANTEEISVVTGEPIGMGAGVPDAGASAEESVLRATIRRAIEMLPERQKAAFLLRWDHGLTNAEVARALGIGEPAASRLLNRAQEAIKGACKL